MDKLLIGNDTAVITLLLLFITALLTKRIVPWYVHQEALDKLKKYEDAAPGLIENMNRLMELYEREHTEEHDVEQPMPTRNPKRVPTHASMPNKQRMTKNE
jgi:hypothetical protein